MSIHFNILCMILLGAGIAGFFAGGFMSMMFDVSEWWPMIGMFLVVCSVFSMIIGGGGQVMIWIMGG